MIDEQVKLLYEAGPVLVVGKPAGLLTQAPPGIDSLEARIKSWIKRRDNKPGNVYLGVPHRLDRPVSGASFSHATPGPRGGSRNNSKGAWSRRSIGPASPELSRPRRAHGPISCARCRASRAPRSSRLIIPKGAKPCCTIACCPGTRGVRGWRSSSRQAARIRFACKRRRVATRCSATSCTARSSPSDCGTKISGWRHRAARPQHLVSPPDVARNGVDHGSVDGPVAAAGLNWGEGIPPA